MHVMPLPELKRVLWSFSTWSASEMYNATKAGSRGTAKPNLEMLAQKDTTAQNGIHSPKEARSLNVLSHAKKHAIFKLSLYNVRYYYYREIITWKHSVVSSVHLNDIGKYKPSVVFSFLRND